MNFKYLSIFLLSPSPTPPPDEMQPPPGYENKDEKPNRYKESKMIITREEALDALRRVLKFFFLTVVLKISLQKNLLTLKVIMLTRNAAGEKGQSDEWKS